MIVTTLLSVFEVAYPIPGKCFIDGTTPADSSPEANAFARLAVFVALNDHVRPCWYMNDAVVAGTSATGARSTLIPRSRSADAVLAPCENASDTLPRVPIAGGSSVGGAQGIRLIEPPSWSTAISNGAWPPAEAAFRSVPVSATRASGVVTFEPKRMTPPTSPRPIRPSRSALGVAPAILTTSFWPTSCARAGAAAVGAGVAVGRAVGFAVGTAVGAIVGVGVGVAVGDGVGGSVGGDVGVSVGTAVGAGAGAIVGAAVADPADGCAVGGVGGAVSCAPQAATASAATSARQRALIDPEVRGCARPTIPICMGHLPEPPVWLPHRV